MTTNISTQINHDFSSNSTFNMLQNDGYPVYADGEKVKHFLRFNSSNINLTDSITQIQVSFQARIDNIKKPSINLGMCLARYDISDSNQFNAFGSGSYSTGANATDSPAIQYAQCKTSVDISSTDWTSYELSLKIPNNLLAGMLYYGITDSSLRFSDHLGIAIGVKNNGDTSNIIQMSGLSVSVIHNTTSPTPTRTLTVITSPSAGGSVSGGGTYNYASPATLIATPASNYTFVRWFRDGVAVSNSPTYTINAVQLNETYVADFSENAVTPTSYYIGASASPSSGGTVSGAGSYTSGSTATLKATASSGYSFKNWTENGSVVSTSSSYSFTVSKARTLVANFEAETISLENNIYVGNNGPFTLPATGLSAFPTFNQANCLKLKFVPNSSGTYTFSSTQSGTITTDPEAQLFNASGTTSFGTGRDENSNSQFKFTSTELIEGSTYYLMIGNWGSYPAANDFYVTVEQASVTPEKSYTLTVIDYYGHRGFSNISPSLGTHEYTAGTNIPLSVTLKTGYYTNGWDYKKETDTSWTTITSAATGTYTMPNCNTTICVDVLPNSYTITAQSNNTSYGTVSNSGGTYSYNSTFTSTATPNTNYQFDGWYKNGSLVTSNAQLSVTVSGNATYTAQFSRKQYTVTYISDGTSTPIPQVFNAGDSVTLAPAVSKNNTTINSSNDFSTTFNPQNGVWSDGSTSSKSINPKKVTSYTFTYWYDGSVYYYAGGSYTLSGDTTFTATWNQSHSYTITAPTISRNNSTTSRIITFYYNDGTSNKSTATSSNTTSYTFKGWYNNTSGGSVKISSNGGYYNPSSGETLYAQWNSSSTGYSKVTFPAFSRDGYTLKGFADSSSATSIKYEAGQEAAVSGTWYAVWEPDILTISLDNKNATTNGTSTLYLKYDTGWYSNSLATTSISKITIPKRTGYTFQGYYTKENGEGTKIIDNTGAIVGAKNFTSSKNIVLYVYWTINYYSFDDNINSKGEEGLFDGNGYTKTLKSGNKNNNTYSYGSVITLSATPNSSNAYDFLYWEINGNPITSNPYDLTITQNTTVIAYFGLRGMSITVNLYKDNTIFTIPVEEENSYVKLWMRELKADNTYSEWQRKPFNTKLTYSSEKVINIQTVIQDGEDYEFDSGTLPQYQIIKINGDLSYSVYCKQIPVINNIYFGKSNKPYTSGYIKDPNLSFEEKISSIWVGNKQIMGKAPTREYPYLEDTLLGNILYVGKNNSFIDSSTNNYRNNLNIYKVIIPEGITHTGSYGFLGCSNLTSVILPKSLITLGTHAFEGTGLKSLYLSKNIETVTTRALCSINNLEKITFSNNLKAIYANNLSGSKITTINFLKTNLETIGSSAFNGTSYLTTVLLPNTLITIGANAFDYDFNLTKIIYNGTVEQWNNILIETTGNECLLNATIYCKDGVINPKEEN